MDTGTSTVPDIDIEVLSKNLYVSLDPSLNNNDRTIVYEVIKCIRAFTYLYICMQYWTKLKEHYLESLQSGLVLLDAGKSKADPLLLFGGLHLLEHIVMSVNSCNCYLHAI